MLRMREAKAKKLPAGEELGKQRMRKDAKKASKKPKTRSQEAKAKKQKIILNKIPLLSGEMTALSEARSSRLPVTRCLLRLPGCGSFIGRAMPGCRTS